MSRHDTTPLNDQQLPEAKAPQQGRCRKLHGYRPRRRPAAQQAGLEGGEAKAKLKHERHEERNGPHPDAVKASTLHPGTEGGNAQKLQVNDGILSSRRMAHVKREANRAKADEKHLPVQRQEIPAYDREAKYQ